MGNDAPKKGGGKKPKDGKKKKLTTADIPKGRLIHDPNEDINLYYEVTGPLLGTGNFSQVKVGTAKHSGEKVAIKIVNKKQVKHKPEMLTNEVEILLRIDHPNVIKLLDLFDTQDTLYLVMELATGGELFDRIVERESYSEADAREVMWQLLNAIEYIHSQDIVHRDLKPENLLLEREETDTKIKLTDFGLSKIFDNEFMLITACGTPGYVAPEILSATLYGPPVDMWSAGVIMYILLCGYPPFYNENDAVLFESILSANYHFHTPYWDHISKPAKDLIRKLLVVEPSGRLTATQAKEMEWFSSSHKPSQQPLPSALKEQLNVYRQNSKIKSQTSTPGPIVAKKKN
jgi:calcium/calmodulin-dependent protein kinase I